MGRWRAYGQTDSAWQLDGDNGWQGIDMLHDPGLVPQGYLSRGENTRLLDGACRKRPGTGYPGDFNPPLANNIIGSGVYSNPHGQEFIMVATAGVNYVWALRFGVDPVKINLNDTPRTVGYGHVEFVQAFNKLYLLRAPVQNFAGNPQVDLVWDGV